MHTIFVYKHSADCLTLSFVKSNYVRNTVSMGMGFTWVWVQVGVELTMGYPCHALLIAPIDFFLAACDINSYPKAIHRVLLFLDFIMTILLFVYIPAHLSLLVPSLALLQHQLQSAFIAVN